MGQLEGWVYVYGVAQEVEADIVLGLLQEEGIPAVKRYPGAGQFLKLAYGLTSGVDIYVPESDSVRARELLQSESTGNDEKPQLPTSNLPPDPGAPTSVFGGRLRWIILGMAVLLAFALLLQQHGLFW